MFENIIKKAISVAKKSNVLRSKLGCCLFTSAGRIVAFTNNTKIYGIDGKFTIHAEERLIVKALRLGAGRYDADRILVVHFMRGTQCLGMAKPCPRCEYLLKRAGFKVWYSDENGDIKLLA